MDITKQRNMSALPRRDSALSSSLSSNKSMYSRHNSQHQSVLSRSSSKSSRDHAGADSFGRTNKFQRIRSASNAHLTRTAAADAIALHERSCAILRSGSSTPFSSSPAECDYSWPRPETLSRATTVPEVSHCYPRHGQSYSYSAFTMPDQTSFDAELTMVDEKRLSYHEVEPFQFEPPPTEVIHWTSNETRRREYAEIDRAGKGLKGLIRRMLPRLTSKSSRSRFYDEKDGSAAGSIRRYRLDLSGEDDDHSTYEASQG